VGYDERARHVVNRSRGAVVAPEGWRGVEVAADLRDSGRRGRGWRNVVGHPGRSRERQGRSRSAHAARTYASPLRASTRSAPVP
jgi:hypothetical protein